MRAALVTLALLAGCTSYDLGEEWRPLSKIVERPNLPAVGDEVVFTKGSHVYVTDLSGFLSEFPPGSVKFTALLLHEQEHARRQFGYLGLPGEAALVSWIGHYATSASFMWREEQRGWYREIRCLYENGLFPYSKAIQTAKSLSENYRTLFGERMASFEEAKAWVDQVLAGAWEPEE